MKSEKPSQKAHSKTARKKPAARSTEKSRKNSAAEVAKPPAEPRRRPEFLAPPPVPEKPPRILGDSKTTSAALALLEKGIRLIYQRDFKKARLELKNLVEHYPKEAEIRVRALSYVQICDREEAAQRRAAVTSDQIYTLGVMEHNRGNYDRAIGFFRQWLEMHPNADYIYYSLAASHALKGDTDEALAHLKRAIELNERNRVYAKNDSDFSPLQAVVGFTDLVGVIQSSSGESSPS